MLVDDECPCLEELEYLLKSFSDIEVTGSYANPLEALSAAESSLPDLVFLDIGMPYLSGVELAEKIHQIDDKVAVVFISAHASNFSGIRLRKPFECLLKPMSQKKLNAVMERLNVKRV